MKRFLFLFLVAVACIVVNAQDELKVKSFLPTVNDLTARTQSVKDNAGNFCALVKVVIPDDKLQFECGNIAPLIIGDVSFHTNEYWVYMASGKNGAKHLKVKHPNYPTIDVVFSEYGFSTLEPQMTYTLVLQKPAEVNLEYKYNRTGAILTSAVVPGLGQMAFKNSMLKGTCILASEALAVGGIFVCNSKLNDWKNKSDMATTATDKKDFMKKADNWTNARNVCIGVAAAIYVYNIIDVVFAKKKIGKAERIVTMQPYFDIDKNCGINMALRF